MALIGPKITWHSLLKEEIADALGANFKDGLTNEVVLERRQKYGKNVLVKAREEGILKKIFNQLKSPLVLILIIAGFITLFLKEYIDTTVIFIAVLINTIIGTLQEERAGKAFQKLNDSQEHFVSVIRHGRKFVIPVEDLVQGDLVFLEAGNFVPADIRLIETTNFEVNESALTGEWIDVPKEAVVVAREKPLAEQFNMVWMGTLVSSGFAKGIVVQIGAKTEIGKIAESLSFDNKRQTPIQRNIKKIAKFLAIITSLIVIFIFILGIWRGQDVGEMLLISVAMAVSVIPEGLPVAVTVVLVLGMERILSKGGLVKNLLAAETLGSTTVILTDKTGTLTKGIMKLSSIYTLSTINKSDSSDVDEKSLLKMAVLSSDGFIEESEKDSEIIVRGRPLEKAIIIAGLEAGFNYLDMKDTDERIDFLPFESENRLLASLNYLAGTKQKRIYISGSPEVLLEKSAFVLKNGKEIKITDEVKKEFQKIQKKWSKQGLRFLALAYKDTNSKDLSKRNVKENKEFDNIVFGGLISFEDSIREDVLASIKTAKEAGTRVIMVTGDNAFTAHKIAQDVGIANLDERVLEGKDIASMNDKDLLEILRKVKVFARILPSQKLRISRILQDAGEIVAMTGDGINDAPALKGADIGIAVNSGTEVAKESSDLILLDNSFSVIIQAIEEGRRIMDNLKKIVGFLLSTSFGELFVIIAALALALPLPILPAQILWINIVGEGAMNFAFAYEPNEKDVMKRRPQLSSSKNILTSEIKKLIFTIGIITGVLSIIIYLFLIRLGFPIEETRTVVFAILALDSIFFSLSFKSFRTPIWNIEIFSNKYLLFSIFLSLTLLFGALTLEPLRELLRLTPLSLKEFIFLLAVGLVNLLTIEVAKFFIFRKKALI